MTAISFWLTFHPAPALAAVIVDDTWADGTRTDTSLPTESAWFASSASSLTNYAPGSMTGLCDATNSRTWLTCFTTTPATPVDLAVGETLKATLVFIPTNVADFAGGSARGLRVGLFNFANGGTRAAADGSFVGSTTSSGTNVSGYLLNQSFYTAFPVDGPMEFWVRTNLPSGNLMGTTANYLPVGASGPAGYSNAPGFVSGTQYTLEFSVARTAASSVDVSVRITGGSLNLFNTATDTSYFNHRFDCVALRCDKSTNTAASFTFKEFKVEVVPAPGTNANLANLVFSAGPLTPAFDSAVTNYSANVSNRTNSVTVTPTSADTNATLQVRVNGGSFSNVLSGTASAPLSLCGLSHQGSGLLFVLHLKAINAIAEV